MERDDGSGLDWLPVPRLLQWTLDTERERAPVSVECFAQVAHHRHVPSYSYWLVTEQGAN